MIFSRFSAVVFFFVTWVSKLGYSFTNTKGIAIITLVIFGFQVFHIFCGPMNGFPDLVNYSLTIEVLQLSELTLLFEFSMEFLVL